MEITTGSKVRISHKLMTGTVIEIGCDKCIVLIDERSYECDKLELTEPIFIAVQAKLSAARKWVKEATYRFFEDESGNGNVKVIVGFLIGSLITIGLALLQNK